MAGKHTCQEKQAHHQTPAAQRDFTLKFIEEGKQSGVFESSISNAAIEIYIDVFQTYFLRNKEVRDTLEGNPELAKEVTELFLGGLIRQKNN